MECILKVENLEYKDILKGITFTLESGKFYSLTGPNSSGKTTLVMSLLGLINYTGNINFMDNYVCKDNVKSIRERIGLLADFRKIEGNVNYNLLYPLLNLGYEKDEAQNMVYELSNKLKISNLLLKDVNELSVSEEKLVLFACSIIHSPNLLIIDDTLQDINFTTRKRILDYLKNIENITVLFVTNNSEDYLISDEILIINDGKIVNQIKKEDLHRNEKVFTNNNLRLPFSVEMSIKLKAYGLISKDYFDIDEMVENI